MAISRSNRKKPKIYFYVLICVTLFIIVGLGIEGAEGYSAKRYVESNSYTTHSFQISLMDEGSYVPYQLEYESESESTIYLLNDTELSQFINQNSFKPIQNWSKIKTLRETFEYDEIHTSLGLEKKEILNEDQEVVDVIVDLHFVVVNSQEEPMQYVLNFYTHNQFYEFVHKFSYHAVIIGFLWLGIQLIADGKREKDEGEDLQASIYIKYGFGYLMGALATSSWEIYGWYQVFNPRETILMSLKFEDIPFESIAGNLLTFLTFFCLGLSILFIGWTVEKDVQQRQIPYVTGFLIVMEILLGIAMFWVSFLSIAIILWLVAMILSLVNILGAYLKIILSTRGRIRKKVLFIFFGLLGTFGFIGLRDFFELNFIFNFLGLGFIIMLYKGIAKIK